MRRWLSPSPQAVQCPHLQLVSSSFSKSETVYAVMNGDGSIKSTTVSEHLYSASGLANVTDKTTLTDIQNTESDAEFTQNGEELVWNTNDTDVYYKGNTDKALPIDVKVTYALDGQEAALEDIIGKSGHLTVTVNLKNNETGTVNVNGKDRTIVTPLITAVGVILGGDASNVTAEHGMIESAAKSSVAAFVTLPGVKDSLSGLLPDEVNSIEDYLQDTVTVEADVENFTCPQVMVACATSTAALGTDNVFDLSSINDLTDGINQLNDAMSQLHGRRFPAGGRHLSAGRRCAGPAGRCQHPEQRCCRSGRRSWPADQRSGHPERQQCSTERRCAAGG